MVILIWGNFVTNNDFVNPNKYPEVKFSDIVTGRLANFLHKQAKSDKWDYDEVVPFTAFPQINPIFYEKYGFGFISLFSADITNRIYADPSSRPFKLYSFYKTKINGETYIVLYQRWLNNGKSERFIPLVVSEKEFINENGQIKEEYMEVSRDGSERMVSPIIKIKDFASCINLTVAGDGYCKWRSKWEIIYSRMTNALYKQRKIPWFYKYLPTPFTSAVIYINTNE